MTGQNTLKQRLKAGETVAAAWLELGSPDVAELLVHAGWDILVIDCEHGVAGLEEGLGLIRAVDHGADGAIRGDGSRHRAGVSLPAAGPTRLCSPDRAGDGFRCRHKLCQRRRT